MLLVMILGYTRIRECHRGESFGAVNLCLPMYVYFLNLPRFPGSSFTKQIYVHKHIYIYTVCCTIDMQICYYILFDLQTPPIKHVHLILIGPLPCHSGSRDWSSDHPMQLYHLAALCVMQMSASDPIRPDLLGRRRRSRPGPICAAYVFT